MGDLHARNVWYTCNAAIPVACTLWAHRQQVHQPIRKQNCRKIQEVFYYLTFTWTHRVWAVKRGKPEHQKSFWNVIVLQEKKPTRHEKLNCKQECQLACSFVTTNSVPFPTKSRAKIVRTLPPNAVFFFTTVLSPHPPIVITVNWPNLAHQHWDGKKTKRFWLRL